MCEANVYFVKNNKEEKVMEGAYIIKKDDDKIYFLNIFGEQEFVKGKIKEVDLIGHKIILE